MIITTAGRTNNEMIQLAIRYAALLQIPYISRRKLSVEEIMVQEKDDVLVVGQNRLDIYPLNHPHEPIFFHPNSAMFRVKRVLRGEADPLVYAAGLKEGMTFLDCTLGLGSDSIVASSVVGKTGRVVGIEGNRFIAFLLQHGLKTWESGSDEMNLAMSRIEVVQRNNLDFLKEQKNNSFDVVYFDPMFNMKIEESDGIKGLRNIALYTDILEETIAEAKRVANKRIVLKDYWKSTRFETFGFAVFRRKTAKFHFGVIGTDD
ncbi:putative SAM-dependent methyltransferase [Schinkia azotoformans MEV2011]|uniref:Putative SAM-dependent methyltransferase n=1 Tax=Schinkia azotoformans MEV2011 TaxID=1348973 RepID=A0A072NJT3_SCHAZ|nr:class I SAM-dependent methyltransferase [Schinkia azotoformans]KEF37964.1 putative SAM-dependent methyltransferase [Schinkia azotoformans MEV2011]MEC1696322.1 class I SAM-dependent methyltransferase [Schinkia azotoformans]MEC1727280.1 class I SAM-dependent methyltransferase [Schinkia azotoformans]MEC1770796.1 class I SAM-dependent methyltransferase [Schinkia azotoformans]MEC1780840.1 class I SAM-dependent methyltransferase [Schinkia azotoformans]